MHTAALAHLGVAATYEAVRVSADDLAAFVARVRRGDLDGFNVTVPHKESILSFVDVASSEARAIGAANTIVRAANGALSAHNTDVLGFVDDLNDHGVDHDLRGLVIGAGGAARAAIRGLVSRRNATFVAARRTDRAHALEAIGAEHACSFDDLSAALGPFDLVVQTTPCGMRGGPSGAPIAALVDRLALTDRAVGYDMIYRPEGDRARTPFLDAIAARGARAIDGRGMLASQGARALGWFLGRDLGPDVRAVMRAELDRRLAGSLGK